MSSSAWRLAVLSAGLQIVIFPLPNLYWFSWIAVTPLIVAILRTRVPETLQLQLDGRLDPARLLPASPWQGFLLGYACGILWFAGTCYWIFDTMHRYGGLPIPAAALALLLFCMYVGLYHGLFGMLLAFVAGRPIGGSKTGGGKTPGAKISGIKIAEAKPVASKLAGAPSIRRALATAPFLWVAVELARTRITA